MSVPALFNVYVQTVSVQCPDGPFSAEKGTSLSLSEEVYISELGMPTLHY